MTEAGLAASAPTPEPDPSGRPEFPRAAGPAPHAAPTPASTPHYEPSTPDEEETAALRERVLKHLASQGFRVSDAGVIAPVATDKDKVRALHLHAVLAQREKAASALKNKEPSFIARLAPGVDVVPSQIRPRLVPIDTFQHRDAPLWRWCSLHWSIPVSGGYGRRLRFLVVDEAHGDAVIGLIGLADPVYALGCRDKAIGWSPEARAERLTSVMDAFVLGAVPPYSHLLGGKLVAALAGAREVREAFAERYGHRTTVIAGRDPDAQLALVTTSSALGRSSVYNRVRRVDGTLVLKRTGFTQGSGDFHFSGAIYDELAAFASRTVTGATHRHERWGATGFRNRREVIQKSLQGLGLSGRSLRFHGIRREVFHYPLATNSYDYLRGEEAELDFFDDAVVDLGAFWATRWAQPRSERDTTWLGFEPQSWRLYTS